MAVTIRPVQTGDHADWLGLFTAYARFYRQDLPPETARIVWDWIHDFANPFWADLAIDGDGVAVGLVQYQLMHRSLGGGMTCYLSDLFTTPQARGLGVGRALIDHVRGFARDRGLPGVRWLTAEDNTTARALYDSYAPASGFILYNLPS